MSRPLCSIVVPVFNEETNIPVMFDRLRDIARRDDVRFEFIFVDDGSTDRSFELLKAMQRDDDRVRVIQFSRNFGSHAAAAAGLGAARGDAAVFMAADLQDPPEIVDRFIERWRDGYEVVWGVRAARHDSWRRRIFAAMFYKLIRRIALPEYPSQGTGSFCLIDRKVIDAFGAFKERNRVTFGLILWSGFRQTQVPYDRAARHSGTSGWTFARLIKAAFDTIFGFSYAPVRVISMAGIVISMMSFVCALYVLARWLIDGVRVPGWPSLLLSILFLGGLQLMVLGVLGEYLWRTLEESRARPLYIVRETVGMGPLGSARDEADAAQASTSLRRRGRTPNRNLQDAPTAAG